jgi:hypothetical protein
VETGTLPVRFIGVGAYSLDIEIVAYVKTTDYDEFLALQQELLLNMLRAVEQAGTALAVPLQESFELQQPIRASRLQIAPRAERDPQRRGLVRIEE